MKIALFLAALYFSTSPAQAADITLLTSRYTQPGTDVYGDGAGDAYFETRLLIQGADVDAILICGTGLPLALSSSVPVLNLQSYSNQRLSVREQLRQHGYSEVYEATDASIEGTCVELRNAAGAVLARKTLAVAK